mmetsp:Transcript_14282/g.21591  ORF Transcript_14282/g.21591 Transcript_14282/m.21591 type:complete len:257 (+) Transcript_14282:76-846(+)
MNEKKIDHDAYDLELVELERALQFSLEDETNWNLINDQNGIRLMYRYNEFSKDLELCRATCEAECDLETIFDVMVNRQPEVLDLLDYETILNRISPSQRHVLQAYKSPSWLISPRYFLLLNSIFTSAHLKDLLDEPKASSSLKALIKRVLDIPNSSALDGEDDSLFKHPIGMVFTNPHLESNDTPKKKSYVLAKMLHNSNMVHVLSPKRVRFSYCLQYDVGGMIPNFGKSWNNRKILDRLAKIRDVCEKRYKEKLQ